MGRKESNQTNKRSKVPPTATDILEMGPWLRRLKGQTGRAGDQTLEPWVQG